MERRDFLKGLAAAGAPAALAQTGDKHISLVIDPSDPVAASAPARWAASELRRALTDRGVAVSQYEALSRAPSKDVAVVAAKSSQGTPESFTLEPGKDASRTVILARGSDPRGLVYALLELADRVRHSGDPMAAIAMRNAVTEQPANTVRSIARLFVSDVHDKPWFHSKEFWPEYLTTLAANRFNRFALAVGIGYDFLREVSDCYLVFAYPFLVDVPGYKVKADLTVPTDR